MCVIKSIKSLGLKAFVKPRERGFMAPQRIRCSAKSRAGLKTVVPRLEGGGRYPQGSALGVSRTPQRIRCSALFFSLRPERACPKNSPARPPTRFASGPPTFGASGHSLVINFAALVSTLVVARPSASMGVAAVNIASLVVQHQPPFQLGNVRLNACRHQRLRRGVRSRRLRRKSRLSSRKWTGARSLRPNAAHLFTWPERPANKKTGSRPWGAFVPFPSRGRAGNLLGFCLLSFIVMNDLGRNSFWLFLRARTSFWLFRLRAGIAFGYSVERVDHASAFAASSYTSHRHCRPLGRLGSLVCCGGSGRRCVS